MSESSFGSSSSVGLGTNVHAEEEDSGLDGVHTLQTGLFGVLYTVAKEKEPSRKFIVFLLVMEWLQLFLVVVNPAYGFNGMIDPTGDTWYAISFIQLNSFMRDRGYTFFLACLYIMVSGLIASVAMCAYVGYSFQNNRFDHVWPIKALRWYSVLFFQVLEVASITLFLMTLDCEYFNQDNLLRHEEHKQNMALEFPLVYCWSTPHLIHVIIASVSLVVFVALALIFIMAEMEPNLLTQNWLSVSHSRVEVLRLSIKALMTCVSVFITEMRILSITQFLLALWLVYLFVQWQPHTVNAMNVVRAAEFTSIWYVTILLLVLAFDPHQAVRHFETDAEENAAELVEFRSRVTLALWVGIVPAGLVGALVSYIRQRFYMTTVVQRFKNAPEGTKSKMIYRFTDPREVEIMVRCCRKWLTGWRGVLDEDAVDPDAVKMAQTIIKAGATQLPNEAFMIILHASFLIDVMGSYQSGYSLLQTAKKANPNFMEQFAIFSREQEHTQQESGAKNGQNTVDLVSYVEFQRNHTLVTKVHKDSLLAMRTFWKILLHTKVSFETLATTVRQIDVSVRHAERVYRLVLNRHPHSSRLLQLYSQFMADIKNDPWSAAKWLAESEKLDHEAEHKKEDELSTFQYAVNSGADKNESQLHFRERRCVVIMNASGTISMTQYAHELFGFTKSKELYGKNINILIPPFFADQHNVYVKNYLATGKSHILGTTSEFIAMRKDKSCFAMHLKVTHLNGVGEDSMFMGVIEPLIPEINTTNAWVLSNGHLAGADAEFGDWFGHKAAEVMGTNLSVLLQQWDVFERVMEVASKWLGSRDVENASTSVEVAGTTVTAQYSVKGDKIIIPGRVVNHKFGGKVKVEVTVRQISIGPFVVYALTFRREEPEQLLLISDSRGRIKYITNSLAALLGGTVEGLMADNNNNALDAILPEPYPQLHSTYRHEAAGPWTSLTQRPPHCCLSGMSVCLKSVSKSLVELPRLIPARLSIQQQQLTTWDVGYAMSVTPISLDEALDERRLQLTVDDQGRVVSVGGSPAALFGFDPKLVKGKHISSFLDVFKEAAPQLAAARKPQPAQAAQPAQPAAIPVPTEAKLDEATVGASLLSPRPGSAQPEEEAGGGEGTSAAVPTQGPLPPMQGPPSPRCHGTALVKSMLLELAERSMASPGVSWRVGVKNPQPLKRSLLNLGAITEAHILRRTKAGVMTVRLKDGFEDADADARQGGPRGGHAETGDEEETESSDENAAGSDLAGSPLVEGGGLVKQEAEGQLLFEMELWRADLLASILEVDRKGRIVGGLANPLCPRGLVTGCSSTKIGGEHISSLVPQMQGRPVQDLFTSKPADAVDGVLGRSRQPSVLRRRSVDTVQQAGPVLQLPLPHLGDDGSVEVSMRAVSKMGSSQAYVVMHARQPCFGREDFAAWLLGAEVNQDKSSMRMPASLMMPNSIARAQPGPAMPPSPFAKPPPRPKLAEGSSFARKYVIRDASPINCPPSDAAHQAESYEMLSPLEISSAQLADQRVRSDGFEEALKGAVEQLTGEAPATHGRQAGVAKGTSGLIEGALPRGRAPSDTPPPDGRDSDHDASDDEQRLDEAGTTRLDSWLKMGDADEPEDGEKAAPRPVLGESSIEQTSFNKARQDSLRKAASGSDIGDEAGDNQITYKQGKRFRMLLKMLDNAQATAVVRNAKVHMVLTVVVLFIIHIATFATMLVLIATVRDSVTDMKSSAFAMRKFCEIAINVRALATILEGATQEGAPSLSGPEDLISWYDDLDYVSGVFQQLHQGVFMGFRGYKQLPTAFGIRDTWENPVINTTMYFDTLPVMTKNYTMYGLWELGNVYYKKTRNLYSVVGRAIDANRSSVNISLATLHDKADYYFIMTNGPNIMYDYYKDTLDSLMQVTVRYSRTVNSIHMIIVCVEGVMFTAIAAAYVWHITQKVTRLRFNMFNCFMQVPQGMIRCLADRKIDLEDEEEAAAAVDPANPTGPAPLGGLETAASMDVSVRPAGEDKSMHSFGKAQSFIASSRAAPAHADSPNPGHGPPLRKRSVFLDAITTPSPAPSMTHKGADPVPGGSAWNSITGLVLGRSGRVAPEANQKRQLRSSTRASLLMITPFILWSLLVIAMNSANYMLLEPLSSSISLLNIVDFVLLRHHTCFFFSLDLTATNSGASNVFAYLHTYEHAPFTSSNERLAYELGNFRKEYAAMLFSGLSVDNSSPHFSMSDTGISTTNNIAKTILFTTTNCLCEDPAGCKEPSEDLYDATRHGLDGLMTEYFNHMEELVLSQPNLTTVGAASYNYILSVGQHDIEGGIVALTDVYYNELEKNYKNTVTLQVLQFVLTAIIAILFFIFMVRPMLQLFWTEKRRIAELLAQLPQGADVETIVNRCMAGWNTRI